MELVELEEQLHEIRVDKGIAEKEPLWIRFTDKVVRAVCPEKKPVSKRKYIAFALTAGFPVLIASMQGGRLLELYTCSSAGRTLLDTDFS